MNELNISQSLIKSMFYKGVVRDYCPHSVFIKYIAKTHEITTDSMDKGVYFESLCLGAGRGGKALLDLPRKKLTKTQILNKETIGSKTIDQIRIEKQHLEFERQKTLLGLSVQKDVNTQVEIFAPYSLNDNIRLSTNMDLFPTPISLPQRGLKLAVIDLKLTADFSTFGEFCWGDADNIDKIQGHMYHYVANNIDLQFNLDINPDSILKDIMYGAMGNTILNNEVLFFFWVFNYKKNELRNKFIEVVQTPTTQKELFESIRLTIEEINKNERKGWNRTCSNSNNCSMCPLLNCPDKFSNTPYTIEPNSNFTQI